MLNFEVPELYNFSVTLVPSPDLFSREISLGVEGNNSAGHGHLQISTGRESRYFANTSIFVERNTV